MLDRAETEIDFYSRRAMEEAHAAAAAASVVVGAAHRHMAAAYAARLRDEQEAEALLDELLDGLDDLEACAPQTDTSDEPTGDTPSPDG